LSTKAIIVYFLDSSTLFRTERLPFIQLTYSLCRLFNPYKNDEKAATKGARILHE